MRRIVFAIALLIAASSCSKCDSCKGSTNAPDAGAKADSAAAAASTAQSATAKPSTSTPPMETNYACRTIARAITQKACECPQKNKAGCCAFGTPPVAMGKVGKVPYVECSKGKTDWPADLETRLCKAAAGDNKKELLAGCFAATKDKLRCGKTAQDELGVEVPRECETLLNEATGAK